MRHHDFRRALVKKKNKKGRDIFNIYRAKLGGFRELFQRVKVAYRVRPVSKAIQTITMIWSISCILEILPQKDLSI